MITLKRDVLDAQLPATLCKQGILDRVEELAREHKTSKASVVRAAVEFFLSHGINQIAVNSINIVALPNEKTAVQP
jgi:hypothetical protein